MTDSLSPTGAAAISESYGEGTLHALEDFLDHAEAATYVLSLKDSLDTVVSEAAIEGLAIRLGESLTRASKRFIDDHPELNLTAIIATRHVVAHGYDIVDHKLLWAAVERKLPQAVAAVEQLLKG
ncbi:MAG: DUF86 domain-containing protein [Promicromonosporaceae bacterium]|nr:DUF86 domain-containing protein [Promicromonosporaceae bacterium]